MYVTIVRLLQATVVPCPRSSQPTKMKYHRAQIDGVIRAKLRKRKHDSGKNTVPRGGTRLSGDNLFQRQVSHETSTKQSLGVEMYVTPITFYALRLSFQQGAVSSVFRKNMAERNITTSACILATVGLSMSIFSVSQMLTSKHPRHL